MSVTKPLFAAALAAFLAAGASPVLAQTATAPGMAASGPAALAQGQLRAKALLEREVRSSDGHNVGEVEDILLDAQGRVVGVVVEVERGLMRGDRHVVVPFERLRLAENRRVELPMTREEIRAMPGFEYRE